MKQTAVQWLKTKYKLQGMLFDKDFQQAKEMEKQQIMDAFEQQIIQWVPELLEDGTLNGIKITL